MTGWDGRLRAAIALAIAVALGGCSPSASSSAEHRRPGVRVANGTSVVADALRGPGTPLSDGLVVPPGAALIGAVFPRDSPNAGPPADRNRDNARALLWVNGDADTVVVDLLRQAAGRGLTAYGNLHINPDPPEQPAERRVSITPTGLPPGKSPLCASIGTPVVKGYRCRGGATAGPSVPGIQIEIMQGDCTRAKCPQPAPSLALVTICCGETTNAPVPFPPEGWNLAAPTGIDPPPAHIPLPASISRPGDGARIALPDGVEALAPALCIGLEECYEDLLILRTDNGQAALSELVRRTERGPSWERYDQRRFRAGRWSGRWVAVGASDDSVQYTLYDSQGTGHDYILVQRCNCG